MPATPVNHIPTTLNTFLAEQFPGEVICWPDTAAERPGTALWLQPFCKTGGMAGLAEKGKDGLSRRIGVYTIDIGAPNPLPAQDAWDMAAALEKTFRRQSIHGVTTEDPYSENTGADASNCYIVRVTIPFWCWAR